MSWFTKALKTCGKAVGSSVKVVTSPVGALGKQIKKIPVVGKPFGAVYNLATGPIDVVNRIAKGQRLDNVAMGHFKGQLAEAKTVAPYAQTVVSFVPGIGQGVSAAVAASVALAEGRPISEALVSAVKNALPGGPAAQAAFGIASAAVQGKSIDEAMLAGLPLSADQKKALLTTANLAKDVANGKRVDESVLKAAQRHLPPQIAGALNTGVALAKGRKLQDAIVQNVTPDVLNTVAKNGLGFIAKNPVMKAGAGLLGKDPKALAGFKVGAGFASSTARPIDLVAVRKKLKGEQRKGFDMALAAHIGQVTQPPSKSGKHPPAAQFGYYLTQGMRQAKPKHKTAMMKVVASDPIARSGAVNAIKEVQWTQAPWWKRLLKELGLAA